MAEVVRYVDPDVSGGLGDGTSWANAYSSLNAWEAAEQTNLVSDGDTHVVNCRASGGTADTTAVNIDGWGVDSTHYVKVMGITTPASGVRRIIELKSQHSQMFFNLATIIIGLKIFRRC